MLHRIKTFFDKKMGGSGGGGVTSRKATGESLRMATAALLIEAVKADDSISEEELKALREGLGERFDIDAGETEMLIRLAEEETAEAVSLYGFTSLINKGFKYDEKKGVIELLWKVVYADSVLEKHEEHLVRRVADLLQVSHKDFIDAKLRVKGETLERGEGR